MTGKFITFEGGEGAGKSSQVKRLAGRLTSAGYAVITTREPGGTPTAEAIRQFVLGGHAVELGVRGEAALMAAARADHVEKLIRPALGEGKWVISDRFMDSTRAYQGAADDAEPGYIDSLERLAVGPTRPDLTVILDLPATVGLARITARAAQTHRMPDRFERDDVAEHEARRRVFLAIAAGDPGRCIVIDATGDERAVSALIWEAVRTRLMDPVD